MLRWIIFIVIYLAIGFYVLQGVRTASRYSWVSYLYVAITLLVLGNFVYQFTMGEAPGRVLSRPKSLAVGFLLAVISFQFIAIIVLFAEDIFRLISATIYRLTKTTTEFSIPSRRRFISAIALGLAALPFGALLYGMYKGKYNFKVLKYTLDFDDLPAACDGYQITQISDVHSGSFDNREMVSYGIDLINEQESDVIFFTGDMVNNKAEEMEPWTDLFAKLHAKDGKFSILGNHDYGDYVSWNTKEEKAQNLEALKKIQHDIGFDLLLNEHRYLERDGEKLALLGVENWGKGGFKKAGDLQLAASRIQKEDFKILLSHDPSHWEEQVINDAYHYHLTLSGHTHGMQFGIEIPGWIKWSPVKWRYTYWAGIYEELGQFINVNRGFGFIGYPGRVGIWPEITVITLKKKNLA